MPQTKQTPRSLDARRPARRVLACVAMLLAPGLAAAGETLTGEQIYQRKCARCHGAMGEGTRDEYPHPLIGDRALPQLTRYIAKTMPEDEPGTVEGEEAEKVALYVHDNFYSKAAQARNKPPRIELSRLTVRQYRNVVADLVGSFRPAAQWGDRRGLKADYFKTKRMGGGRRGGGGSSPAFSRVDPEIRFDFAKSSPDPEKIEPMEFSIRWQGSVLAPETGEYEFLLKTENSGRLFVNDMARPLIDAYVKSGKDTEYRATIRLQAGRAYPLRLEYVKAATQGVEKKQAKDADPGTASVALEWKVPHRAAEVIPQRNLSPEVFPEGFVLETPFPPDDRSVGYERGTSVSKAWDQATTDGAIEVAGYVVGHLAELSGAKDGAADRVPRLKEFGRRFAERAFRRPLTDEEAARYVDRQFEGGRDPELAIKRVVLLVLKSPRFLYREVGGGLDPYDVASRLAFGLWDSLPDQVLLDAAASGQLATLEQVTAQAERILPDLRTRSKLREFLLQWLKVDQVPEIAKDPAKFPEFNEALTTDLRTSLDLFLEDVVWGESSDFRQLLTADFLYLNGRLGRFYGADLPADAPFQKVALDPEARAGVLTHPYLMAAFAYTSTTSPIHRGVFLARSVLGRALRPPPEAFSPLPADLHPDLTTRERVALQTRPQACQSCHGMINPLGFTLEHFDAVGRYRVEERGRSIDATGFYQARSGELVKFAGIRDLALFLADSDEAHLAFVEQLFHDLVKQPVRAYGVQKLADLEDSFANRGFSIRKLMVEIVATTALTPRDAKP